MFENKNIKILLVDDEDDIIEFLGYNLRKEGFNVFSANEGQKALTVALKIIPDLIILDVMMPNMDGIETCEKLRAMPELKNCLIVFLTARGEDYSEIAGFNAGADDYITKPLRPRVLISRIKALLKRKFPFDTNENILIKKDDLVIDIESHKVFYKNNEIYLPNKEFKLLVLLIQKPQKLFTREEIFSNIWGDDVVGDRTIDVHIRKLREKLDNKYIKTIKGIGYKFENS